MSKPTWQYFAEQWCALFFRLEQIAALPAITRESELAEVRRLRDALVEEAKKNKLGTRTLT